MRAGGCLSYSGAFRGKAPMQRKRPVGGGRWCKLAILRQELFERFLALRDDSRTQDARPVVSPSEVDT